MAKRMTDYQLTWKKRNMRFLMIFGPLMVLAFTVIAIGIQYQINSKAIQEGHSIGFQFTFLFPISPRTLQSDSCHPLQVPDFGR